MFANKNETIVGEVTQEGRKQQQKKLIVVAR